jgi:hypothetical protein
MGIDTFEPGGEVHWTYEFEPLVQVTLVGVTFAAAKTLVSQ